jgi:hypothetical protein
VVERNTEAANGQGYCSQNHPEYLKGKIQQIHDQRRNESHTSVSQEQQTERTGTLKALAARLGECL